MLRSLVGSEMCIRDRDDSATQITLPDPPGKQYDISWPSLTNSPWPMNHHDPQSTGRSKLLGPSAGMLEWNIEISSFAYGGIAVTPDSLVLVSGRITGLTMDGAQRWTALPPGIKPFDEIQTTPIVRDDSVILCASGNGIVYAINPNGSIQWQYATNENIVHVGPNIGLDGTYYCISSQSTLFAINRNGTLKWKLTDPRFFGWSSATLTFSPDGQTLYVPGLTVGFCAIDISSRSVKWTFGYGPDILTIAPIVDCVGNIYFLGKDSSTAGKPSLFSLRPDGSIRWAYVHGNKDVLEEGSDPTIDVSGNIYFAGDTLYSVDYEGHFRWKLGFGIGQHCWLSLVCDANSTVYLSIFGSGGYTEMAAGSDGNILWGTLFNTPRYTLNTSPAIVYGNRLIMQGQKNAQVYKWR